MYDGQDIGRPTSDGFFAIKNVWWPRDVSREISEGLQGNVRY